MAQTKREPFSFWPYGSGVRQRGNLAGLGPLLQPGLDDGRRGLPDSFDVRVVQFPVVGVVLYMSLVLLYPRQ